MQPFTKITNSMKTLKFIQCSSYFKVFLLLVGLNFTALSLSAKSNSIVNTTGNSVVRVLDDISKGDDAYLDGRYDVALKHYLKAYDANQNNASLNYKIGFCYYKINVPTKAIEYLEKAYSLDNNVSKDVQLFLGYSYQATYQPEKAKNAFQLYKNSLKPEDIDTKPNITESRFDNSLFGFLGADPNYLYTIQDTSTAHIRHSALIKRKYKVSEDLVKDVDKRSTECDNEIALAKRPLSVRLLNIGGPINTIYPEYAPIVSSDHSFLVFTSRRPEQGENYDYDKGLTGIAEKVFISYREGDKWKEPTRILTAEGADINMGTSGMSPDNKTLYFFKDKNGGDIYEGKFENNQVKDIKALPAPINTKFYESCATITKDGKTMYFISDRPEGNQGGKDIYVATLADNGAWNAPVNLGPSINTPYDEVSVVVVPQGNVLYFSSRGHNSMGGYDIFKSIKDKDGNWSKPMNLGAPINTPNDDVFFTIAGQNAYFASPKIGNMNDLDIYQIGFDAPKNTVVVDSTRMYNVAKGTTNAVNVNPNGFLFNTGEPFIVEDTVKKIVDVKKDPDKDKNVVVEVKKDTARYFPSKFIVYFNYADHQVTNAYDVTLDSIAKRMKNSPELKLYISGHTCNIGTMETQQSLSDQRAQSVANYLINNKGIDRNRINAKGYNFSIPSKPNDSDENRAKNRRAEFLFLKP